MKKLPKLINRYTSSKNYYSYEKDYLYEIKSFIRQILGQLNDRDYDIDRFIDYGKLVSKEAGTIDNWLAMFLSIKYDYPVYYISDDFIDLAINTKGKEGITCNSYFVDNAIFLFPKHNQLKIKFCLVSTTIAGELFGYFDRVYVAAKFLSSTNWFNYLFHKENILTNHSLTPKNSYVDLCQDEINLKVAYLIPQVFLYMATYQEKGMSIESESSGQGFKQSSGKLLTPPTIGFNERLYVNQQRQSYGSNPDLQGIKKQTHWRRGHWRQYDNEKLTWIRPCLINPIIE